MSIPRYGDINYYDYLASNMPSERVNNVNVFGSGTEEEEAICQIDAFYPFSNVAYEEDETAPNLPNPWVFMDVTATLLAIYHLNYGIGDVVPALKGLNETCDLRFVVKLFDDEGQPPVAVDQLSTDTTNEENSMKPCAVLGSYNSEVSSALSTMSYVHTLFHSIMVEDEYFESKEVYPYIARLTTTQSSEAVALVRYLKTLDVSHVALIYRNEGNYMLDKKFQEEALRHGIVTKTFPINQNFDTPEESKAYFKLLVERLKSTKYHYFCSYIKWSFYDDLMTEAYEQRIVGPGFNWIMGSGLTAQEISHFAKEANYTPGSPLYIATQGISVIKNEFARESDEFPVLDNFLNAWQNMSEDMISYVNSKFPVYDPVANPRHNISVQYAEQENYKPGSNFYPPDATVFEIFDSVVGLGLAACAASRKTEDGAYFNGQQHFNAFVNMDGIESVSGSLKFLPTGSRDPTTALYGITNIIATGEMDEDGYYAFSKDRKTYFLEYDRSTETSNWVPNPEYQHYFSDGTTTPPHSLPPLVVNMNYIPTELRGVVIGFSAIVILLSLACAGFTIIRKNTVVIKSSQSFFLLTVIFGTLLMGVSLILFTFDDDIASERICTIACISSNWLVIYGFCFILSSIFSKKWRLKKIIKNNENDSQRGAVLTTNIDFFLPFFLQLGFNTLILSLWTIMSPHVWTRSITKLDIFGRTVESVGQCTPTDRIEYWIFPLFLLLVNSAILSISLYLAFNTRNFQTEFNENHFLSLVLVSLFEIGFVGTPLFFFLSSYRIQYLLFKASVVFIVCVATLILIFFPKIFQKKFGVSQIPVTKRNRFSTSKNANSLKATKASDLSNEKKEKSSINSSNATQRASNIGSNRAFPVVPPIEEEKVEENHVSFNISKLTSDATIKTENIKNGYLS
jgi:hypothetical protein